MTATNTHDLDDPRPWVMATRPQPECAELAALLDASGYRCVQCPALTIRARRASIAGLPSPSSIVFVSGNAVRHAFPLLSALRGSGDIAWYAIGARTAQHLRDHGVVGVYPRADESAHGVLALPALQRISGEQVWIVSGAGGLDVLATGLRARGARVTQLDVYERVALSGADFASAWRDYLTAVLTSSGDALTALAVAAGEQGLTAALLRVPVVVPSERAAEVARAHGWLKVLVAKGASNLAMLAALRPLPLQSNS